MELLYIVINTYLLIYSDINNRFLNVELSLHSFFFFNYFWLRWVFVAARGLSLVAASGGYSLLRGAGFSLLWLLLLQSTGPRCAGFSSGSTWAQ